MNTLGIDYGEKRIGLAWVQAGLDVVLPFGKIENSGSEDKKNELVDLIKKEKINNLVVGLPLGTDGNENDNTKRVREFASALEKETGLEVELIDERFSSKLADSMGGDASRDEKSAMAILQTYLDKKK